MAETVTTIQGDTWDTLAFRVWGARAEVLCDRLMDSNPDYLGVVFFSGGIELDVPEVADSEIARLTVPLWQEAG